MAISAQRLPWRPPPTRHPSGVGAQSVYRPRHPAASALYAVVQNHIETFLAHAAEADPVGYGLPTWVEKDFRDHASRGARLRCGMTSASLRRTYPRGAVGGRGIPKVLAEEMGLLETPVAQIERRAWPARGMVGDAGLHVLGWTNDETAAYFRASGSLNEAESLDALDRIAVMPAQLTSYDSGALEIFALRREAEAALGDRFDLREFHTTVLEAGIVPMPLLRARVEAWFAGR